MILTPTANYLLQQVVFHVVQTKECIVNHRGKVVWGILTFKAFLASTASSPSSLTHVRASDFSGTDASQGSWKQVEAMESNI